MSGVAEANDVPIKSEVGADVTPIKQELNINPPANDVSIKCEVRADVTLIKQELDINPLAYNVPIEWEGTLIKQELDISPTVIQFSTNSCHRLQAAETATSALQQSSSLDADWASIPLHYESLVQPTSSRVISEESGSPKSSFSSDVSHGFSDEGTSTTYNCDNINKKPYKCKACPYSASQKSHLQRHMRTHTGEKPYKCKHCDYSASVLSTLQTHMHTHTGEKPYKCEHCSYCASQHSTLKTHMRRHTGEKPYRCKHCDYSATVHSHLKNHVMRRHGQEKPYAL